MEKRNEINIHPILPNDIEEISQLEVLADRRMAAQLAKKTSYKTILTPEEKEQRVTSWRTTFRKVAEGQGQYSCALKACSSQNDSQFPRILGCVFGMMSREGFGGTTLARIEGVYVHPDHWREGIASRLLGESVNGLKKFGAKKFELFAEVNNSNLQKFYTSQGWSRDNSKMQSYRMPDGIIMSYVRYERD